ncbi:unnamed protein product [Brugia timori]|uniref:DDE Tnp4 domain-containing protein n=1 Tax=Brugia timori TaxID=42155 RepID=A0A0R3QEQ9_9BILA|nr:unnamed protein product [Brugia timori]
MKHLKPGDLILADKGFLISELLPTGVSLNIPPFKVREQFTIAEILETNRIARARIHVERALCATLVNLQTPILKEMESTFVNKDEDMD